MDIWKENLFEEFEEKNQIMSETQRWIDKKEQSVWEFKKKR